MYTRRKTKMAKKMITKAKPLTKEQKQRRIEKQTMEYTGNEVTIRRVFLEFMLRQRARGNSAATLSFYERFYKKLAAQFETGDDLPIDWLIQDVAQSAFIMTLGNVNQQTINSYLRAYRAFGNFAEEKGYIEGFECHIKEIDPPLKSTYTNAELDKLLVKPDVEDFTQYRNYIIITLLLSTGVRCNTLLNIKIEDVDLEEGYITLQTTKAHKVVRLGMERKLKKELGEYIALWRSEANDAEPTDYLFCNVYGEQLTRDGINKAIAKYNKKHGVKKTSIHLFRHTFAKHWITSGGDIISLAQVLTHSELEMVKRYANLYGSDVTDKIEQHSPLSSLRTRSGKTIGSK